MKEVLVFHLMCWTLPLKILCLVLLRYVRLDKSEDNLVLSTGLIMSVTHHKEIPKLMFGALPFVGASQGIVVGGFIYRKMELCYWLLHGNVKKQ